MSAPLDGIRVLEVANWLAVPAAGALMADMGASVTKVEPLQGDPWRNFQLKSLGMTYEFPGNVSFEVDNRGKRSVALNLERPEAGAAVLRMAQDADVFITNLVPGRRERYGLTYEAVAARNPRVIYLGFSGYGAQGPDRDRLGFDYAAYWARSGIMSLVGEPDGAPALQRTGMGDHTTAPLLLAGVLAALFERERTGKGQEVSGSLLSTGLWVLSSDIQAALVARQKPRRVPRTHAPNPIWNTYQAGDGKWFLLVMPTPDPYWPRLCAAVGRADLADDPRYATLEGRMADCAALVAALDAAFATATRDEWAARLDAHGVIWAPAQDLEEVMADPQIRANGYFTEIDHPVLGTMETVNTPIQFSESKVGPRGPAPEVGQHTEEALLEAGYSWDDIGRLRHAGAIGG
ncbi:MAG: CoA transferase [Chloroflexi bacterium]|nr:CoA transferase [Chloroflexota bacterium]